MLSPALASLLEAANVLLHVGLLRCVLWLGSCSAEVSPRAWYEAKLKAGVYCILNLTPTCALVLPLRLSIIYFKLILL